MFKYNYVTLNMLILIFFWPCCKSAFPECSAKQIFSKTLHQSSWMWSNLICFCSAYWSDYFLYSCGFKFTLCLIRSLSLYHFLMWLPQSPAAPDGLTLRFQMKSEVKNETTSGNWGYTYPTPGNFGWLRSFACCDEIAKFFHMNCGDWF